MASSKVAHQLSDSLSKESPSSVSSSVSDDSSDSEKDFGLEDFDIIKTIGKTLLAVPVHLSA